jgi:signal transduction histidine kinase
MQSYAPPRPSLDAAATDAALLAVLLTAESTRDGASAILRAISPAFEDVPAALAIRDRDGLTLHVLAEHGEPRAWPQKLEPQFALGAQPGVDPSTEAMVVPMRANGRVIGAVLLADAPRAATLVRSEEFQALIATAADVLRVLLARTDAEIRRRGRALHSVDTIVDAMAHQMANPLTGASAIAQLLVEDLQDEGQRAAVAQIRQELTRAFAVLSDILDFQRDTHAQDGVLDLNAVAERVVRFRAYAIREQGIALDVSTAAAFLPVRADGPSLEHVLHLAMRFAELRSHGTVNRRIAVRVTELPNAEVAVQVTDSGTGAPPELAPAYFDLPFRVERQAGDFAMDAPDLGYVGSVLRGFGGRLDVHGSKFDGTTLVLVLPKAYTHPPVAPRTRA